MFGLALIGAGLARETTTNAVFGKEVLDISLSEIKTSASVIRADNQSRALVSVVLRDSTGKEQAGLPVMLATSRGSVDTVQPIRSTTNEKGEASFVVSSNTAGHTIVKALVNNSYLPTGIALTFVKERVLLDGKVVQEKGTGFYYQIVDGKKHWIPNEEVAHSYALTLKGAERVDPQLLNAYPRVKLIRLPPERDERIFYLTETGMKRHILSVGVFYSYGNFPEDVLVINETELNSYPDNKLIRAEGDYKVYLLENGQKHWIVSPKVFEAKGFRWDRIAPVSKFERDRWPEGRFVQ